MPGEKGWGHNAGYKRLGATCRVQRARGEMTGTKRVGGKMSGEKGWGQMPGENRLGQNAGYNRSKGV